jgi:phosphoribosyl-ATP pyrophosphohydrolase/phosphoribosyl-AMP cyclohydrolase
MTPVFDPGAVAFGADGLIVAVVQAADDARVLMVGWMDAEAIAATLATGEVHFHSRSRDTLWRKGETSGNVLRLRSMTLDCDRDAVLVTADPAGPVCHTGTRSCFDVTGAAEPPGPGFGWLDELWATIQDRAARRPAGSYTVELLDGGVDATARKVVEEATEVVIAAKDDAAAQDSGADRSVTRHALAGELADLLFHALVTAAERGVPADVIVQTLKARHRPGRPRSASSPADP